MDRRTFVALAGGVIAEACSSSERTEPAAPTDAAVIRVASVRTAVEGGLLPRLVEMFHAAGGARVDVTVGEMVYSRAREGAVDLVVSHFGHKEAEQFVVDGLGEFPRTVFSNQMALVGPPSDPAGVRDLDDAGEAFRRIAAGKHPFVLNDLDGVKYLTEILWNSAGKPDRAGWFVDDEASRLGALERAAKRNGYTLWGLTPFLRTMKDTPLPLEPLVLADPLFQRMLVTVVVKPGRHPVNVDGAQAFQSFLLSPPTQAAIRTVRYPGAEHVAWVPAGRHNRTAILPKV